MTQHWLILGATGMLGQAVMREAARRGVEAVGAARHGADTVLDITDAQAVRHVFGDTRPTTVLNVAAMIEIPACEADPAGARRVNAQAVGILAREAEAVGARLIQISTDQYWTGDGPAKHDETAPVTFVNEYARSKYAGEQAALDHGALVIRTNVTGFRGWTGRPTFVEWCLETIRDDKPVTLFTDAYTSTIDAAALARAIFDLAETGLTGIVNVGAREVTSKASFIRGLAGAIGKELHHAQEGSVMSLMPRRADSLGLDVAKAEQALGYELPDAAAVCRALVQQAGEQSCVM